VTGLLVITGAAAQELLDVAHMNKTAKNRLTFIFTADNLLIHVPVTPDGSRSLLACFIKKFSLIYLFHHVFIGKICLKWELDGIGFFFKKSK
jgi:hypothetical protein